MEQRVQDKASDAKEIETYALSEGLTQDADNREENETPHVLRKDYLYLRCIGEGANGKTYLARSRKDDREVAIKALKNADVFKSYELFMREAEVLKSIHTEGIPKFYDAIFDQEFGEAYLVQEFVKAPSLQELLDKGHPFTEEEILNMIRQMAVMLDALETQYAPPIIHRDIKPSNILCDIDNSMGCYLIDFGAVANPQKKTQGSTVAGTLGYMAPEQWMGDCTIASDYYGLGTTALHMLTGTAPYDIPSEGFRLKYDGIIRQKAPKCSPAMRLLLDTLLQTRPENRPVTAKNMINYIDVIKKGISPDAEILKSETPDALAKALCKKHTGSGIIRLRWRIFGYKVLGFILGPGLIIFLLLLIILFFQLDLGYRSFFVVLGLLLASPLLTALSAKDVNVRRTIQTSITELYQEYFLAKVELMNGQLDSTTKTHDARKAADGVVQLVKPLPDGKRYVEYTYEKDGRTYAGSALDNAQTNDRPWEVGRIIPLNASHSPLAKSVCMDAE